MTATPPTLHMLCGKIASGKSTLAAELARREGTVLISEDAWLSTLFSDQMSTGADYVRCSAKLRQIMAQHVTALLKAGVSVVLDFPANTPETRKWMREILDLAGAAHELHLFDLPDDLCLARLRNRNAEGTHAFTVTEDLFHRFSRNFVPPSPDEGFTIVVHGAEG